MPPLTKPLLATKHILNAHTRHALLQLVSLVGQGVAGSLGDARELPSNFFEQMVTWALVGLGWQLRRRLERQQQRVTRELKAAQAEARTQRSREPTAAGIGEDSSFMALG